MSGTTDRLPADLRRALLQIDARSRATPAIAEAGNELVSRLLALAPSARRAGVASACSQVLAALRASGSPPQPDAASADAEFWAAVYVLAGVLQRLRVPLRPAALADAVAHARAVHRRRLGLPPDGQRAPEPRALLAVLSRRLPSSDAPLVAPDAPAGVEVDRGDVSILHVLERCTAGGHPLTREEIVGELSRTPSLVPLRERAVGQRLKNRLIPAGLATEAASGRGVMITAEGRRRLRKVGRHAGA